MLDLTKYLAHFFSIVFHPLFMLTYGLIFLLAVNPYLFGASRVSDMHLLILLVFISSFIIPFVALVVMRMLGMIKSIRVHERENRIGPYIVTGTLYLWLFINLKNQSSIPVAYNICVLGSIISLFVCFFINIFQKISAHAAGVGAMIAFIIIVRMRFSYGFFYLDIPFLGSIETHLNYVIPLSFIIAGAVVSSRLYLKAHNYQDVLLGFVVGFVSQLIALRFLL